MKITSPEFENGSAIPMRHTCDGGDVRPTLRITDAPVGTVSTVIVMDDPDAAAGDWVHWVCWNLPAPGERGLVLSEGPLPVGATEGTNTFGAATYGGPCPGSGTHGYFFKAYALDQRLDLPLTATKVELEAAMEGHILDKAGLIGTYARH